MAIDVEPEVSTIEAEIAGINRSVNPSFSVRRARTTVEVASGQTFAIAGIYQKTRSETVRALPYLREVPILGRFFESRAISTEETELVILTTPYLVGGPSVDDKPTRQITAVGGPVAGFMFTPTLERTAE